MISSMDLEKTVLKGLLQHPHKWAEVSVFLNEKDFFSDDSQVHLSIFKLIRNALNNMESIDDTILIPRLEQLKVSFETVLTYQNTSAPLFTIRLLKIYSFLQ